MNSRALGCLGLVTDGSVRDIDQLAPDFQMLAGLIAPSHAFVHVARWACEININGMVVKDGDLIHADRHGAVVVPLTAVRGVLESLDLMVRREAVILEAARRPGATVNDIEAIGADQRVKRPALPIFRLVRLKSGSWKRSAQKG